MTQHPSELEAVKKGVLPRLISDFMKTESASGIVMIAFAVLALIAANSPWSGLYKEFINTSIGFGINEAAAAEPLKVWVKDILMVFFFLIVGLELKREMREGFLSRRDQILLPLLAAAGGMFAPAVIFFAFNHGHPANLAGWAIPSATDIAFALCVLMLVGRNIPPAVKIFLLAIAIFDDLGAILIIAAFYNSSLAFTPLILALAGFLLLTLLNRQNVTALAPYMLTGVYLWFCLYHSGIHTTIAGVAVGMAIPMRDKDRLHHSPLNHAMHLLHPWVSFVVLPIFAFTSAGVSFAGMQASDLLQPLPLGIALGLFFGKQIGIFGTAWLLVTMRLASKPEGASWMHIYGVSIIAGIGFTMSLFIGLLAFSDPQIQEMVKVGVIFGSLLSTLGGFIVLRFFARAGKL
jgi:NhaA family Na+:H+ antiporter